jgi:ribonuclease HI
MHLSSFRVRLVGKVAQIRRRLKGDVRVSSAVMNHVLAARTDSQGERLEPYTVAPWECRNPWQNRLTLDASVPPTLDGKRERVKIVKEICARAAQKPDTLTIFTDGSRHAPRSHKRTGAAYVIYYQGQVLASSRLGLGRRANVYDGEMAALAAAAQKVHDLLGSRTHIPSTHSNIIILRTPSSPQINSRISHIDFFVDNISAISSIYDISPHPAQSFSRIFHTHINSILRSFNELSVKVSWAPGHTGIAGNERADELAKAAVELTPPLVDSTISWAKEASKIRATLEWTRQWQESPRHNHAAVALRTPPSTKPWRLFRENCSGPRHITTRLIQVITGHAFFGNYYKRFRPMDPTSCACDNYTLQTREHVICDCPLFNHARYLLREVSPTLSLPVILGTQKGLAALAKFLATSSAFVKASTPGATMYQDAPTG